MKLQLGLNSCTNAEYHADSEYLSSSNYKTLLTDPEKFYKEKILGERESKESSAFTEGSLTHSLILESHLVESEYAFYPGLRKQGADYEQFARLNAGRPIVSKPQRIRAEAYRDAYSKNATAKDLLKGCESEATICAVMNDIPTKVRCDAINVDKGYIVDVKTSAFPADHDSFKLTVPKWRYDLSAALYAHVAELHYGKPFDFYFIVIGKTELVCEVYKASKKTLETGLLDIAKAASIYKKCKASGVWKLDQPVQISKEEPKEEILEV